MSNFRTRILGLAAMATAFVGMSYGQNQVVTCVTGAQTNPTLRVEGQTELLATMVVTCTNNTAASVATTGTVFIQTSAAITSKAFSVLGVPSNEATLTVTGAGVNGVVQGVVSGNQVSFTLPVGAIPAGVASAIFTITNIRVNASAAAAPQVTESGILSYNVTGPPASSSNTAIAASAQGAGFILRSLGPATLTAGSVVNFVTCTGNPGSAVAAPTVSFIVNINELVSGAFLTQVGEQGQTVVAPNIGTASSGDILNVTVANVPGSATIYVPQAITVNGTTLTIANSTPVASGPLAGLVGFTPSSGTVVVPYTVTVGGVFGAQTFPVPVTLQFAANSAVAQGAVTASVAYGPAAATLTAPATSIPTFLAITTPVTVNTSVISLCQTSLLFPFVTNQLGFDTGIVLANTSADNLGTIPGRPSSVSAQSGTCLLSFFGVGAPTPSVAVPDPQGSTASGTTHAFLLSSVAAGFQGYAIATCPFVYAHGFAFIEFNLTQNNGVVEGYLAEVLANPRPAGAGPEAITF